MSQDPMFWSPEKLLDNPQSMNSYSYGNNNPITNKDPLGLYAVKTGTIEKGDTLSKITNILNTTNSTNYSVSQVAKLNGIKDENKIQVGQVLIPNSKNPDITSSLSNTMKENSKDSSIHSLNGVKNFYEKVKTGGPWDFKNNPDSLYYKNNGVDSYIFNGRQESVDFPGNANYGYTGNSTWWGNPNFLLLSAGAQQVKQNAQSGNYGTLLNLPYFDNPNDSRMIQSGIDYYKNK